MSHGLMALVLPKRRKNSKNYNYPSHKTPRRYLAPQLGNASYGDRLQLMRDFVPEFKSFLTQAGITPAIQSEMEMEFTISVDPRWQTSACDNVSAKCFYLGGHFAVWSNGSSLNGQSEFHLFGELTSGRYRSGACTNPEEFGRKFALLICEAERIKDLRWWHRIPEHLERICQCLITLTMCVSFFVIPNNDWEKTEYFAVFVALTACALLSYISRVKEDDSLIDSEINQQAIAFK